MGAAPFWEQVAYGELCCTSSLQWKSKGREIGMPQKWVQVGNACEFPWKDLEDTFNLKHPVFVTAPVCCHTQGIEGIEVVEKGLGCDIEKTALLLTSFGYGYLTESSLHIVCTIRDVLRINLFSLFQFYWSDWFCLIHIFVCVQWVNNVYWWKTKYGFSVVVFRVHWVSEYHWSSGYL